MLNIVLFEPEIPENTGNISRNCVGFNLKLHMIKPYGFILNDKSVKRAGLDYWKHLQLNEYDSWIDFERANNVSKKTRIFFLSKRGKISTNEINLKINDVNEEIYLVFGRESSGISPSIIEKYNEQIFYIPMGSNVRSFNLSNCVAIMSYEFCRQNNFRFI